MVGGGRVWVVMGIRSGGGGIGGRIRWWGEEGREEGRDVSCGLWVVGCDGGIAGGG